jgi:uncharacterized membrane protein
MQNEVVADATRAVHDIGLANWVGGAMFGKFALNPAVRRITARTERGEVVNAAWNGYNVVNAISLGAVALGWLGSRFNDAKPSNLTGRESNLAVAKDLLVAAAVASGAANAVFGARLAAQAPDGAVPIESGTTPAPETPAEAASIQRTLGVLGNVNILAGMGIIIVNALMAQEAHSRPPARRSKVARFTGQT